MMDRVLAVALGGAVGALLRWAIAVWTLPWALAGRWPLGTFIANVLGGFLMGLLFQLFRHWRIPAPVELLLLTGMMGALTTFSTFGLETVRLYQDGLATTALLYLVVTNGAVILAVWLGLNLGRTLF